MTELPLQDVTNIWDFLKWVVFSIMVMSITYIAFKAIRDIQEVQKEAREAITISMLRAMVKDLAVTDSNYDDIIIEFDKIEYLNQAGTRLKDEFLKKFAKIHEKRLNAKMNNASLIPVRAENMIKEIESNLSQVAKDRAKTKDRILMKELNAKEDMLIIQLETLTNLITVAGVEPVKTRKRKVETKEETV